MPELPEVETVRLTLAHLLGNPCIQEVNVRYPNLIETHDSLSFSNILIGKTIKDYKRIGKYLMFDLGDYMLISHLRMEGKYYVQKHCDSYDPKHTHLIIRFENEVELRYHDTRKFGRMYLYKKAIDPYTYPCMKNVGYDVFDERITVAYLWQMLHHRTITLKQALLDQRVMAGVGNIYADEICFALHLHPETNISHLRKSDFECMILETRRILTGASNAGGTTIRSYTSQLGVDGRFQLQLKVHGREKQVCYTCGNLITKIRVGGRGTYYCKECQKKR
ncbi:MAG: bifunctional DNA-formamidopyrimidine glycosylase/DNA-(apurinic or apyrimidinic site) lyase [Erysipelotrichaceae bacterium]